LIVLDTSVLIAALSSPGDSGVRMKLRQKISQGERILVPCLALYEWLRGPRVPGEISAQEALFPSEQAVVFGPREAEMSGRIYKAIRKPRGREIDICIAACAILRNAALWTLNTADFADIPGIRLEPADTASTE
jgi:predicted nucleic acid-binding protein